MEDRCSRIHSEVFASDSAIPRSREKRLDGPRLCPNRAQDLLYSVTRGCGNVLHYYAISDYAC